jgi:hypothetical protein
MRDRTKTICSLIFDLKGIKINNKLAYLPMNTAISDLDKLIYVRRNRNLREVFSGSPHLSPGFIEQLDTDAEELLKRLVMTEEHGVIGRFLILSYNQKVCTNYFRV